MKYVNILISKFKIFRNSHKYLPSDTNPIKLKETYFYSNYLVHKEKTISYEEIYAISNRYSEKYVNHIRTEIELTFRLYCQKNENTEPQIIDLSYSLEIFGWRKRETTIILLNYLLEKTYQNRLKKYLDEIKTNGFFNYLNVKIFKNGDLYNKDEYVTNIYQEHKNGNVWYGITYSSILGRNKGEDPYLFRIKNGIKNSGFFQKKDVDINTQYNKDIFDVLIKDIMEYGTILTTN